MYTLHSANLLSPKRLLNILSHVDHRFTKGSKESANVNLSEQDGGNDYNLRGRALRDGKEQTPELPNREYLEDIDFLSKEFDLFFKHKPDLPTRKDDNLNGDSKNETEKKVSCSKEQPAKKEKCAEEASHYMSLKDAQEGGQSSVSVYESLKPQNQQPTAYENVNFKKEESNSESHYQPLILAKHVQGSKDCTSSHYQSLNVKLT